MASPLSERIGSLVGERTRIDALLAGDMQWQALLIARAAAARGEASAAADVERLEAALSASAMFRAREALDAAIRELTAAGAEASVAAEDARAPLVELVRPRPEVRIHSHPPTLARGSGADDLTRIRGIDDSRAAGLAALGVTSYAAIASWTAADVASFAARLGAGAEISRGNWIEQAAVLAGKAARARADAPLPAPPEPLPMTLATPAPTEPAAAAPAAVVSAAAGPAIEAAGPSVVVVALHRPQASRAETPIAETAPVAPGDAVVAAEAPAAPDRLTLVRGLTAEMADWLAAAGVTRFAEIAAWTAGDLACYGAEAGIGEAARRESWIEQAAALASGRTTHHARRVLAGEVDALVPPPRAEARPDGELRAKLIAASLLSAANAMLRTGPLPPAEPIASEPARIAAEERVPAASAPAAYAGEAEEEARAPTAFELVARAQPPLFEGARGRQPRLAEQIVPLTIAAPEATAGSERTAQFRQSTLGSWSAPTSRDDAVSAPIDAEWSEIPDAEAAPIRAVEAAAEPPHQTGWPLVQPGEAEVVIHRFEDEAAGGPSDAGAARPAVGQPDRHHPSFTPRRASPERGGLLGALPEEASVEIYTHGEQPRPRPAAVRPAAAEDSAEAAMVRRFLRGLTGR